MTEFTLDDDIPSAVGVAELIDLVLFGQYSITIDSDVVLDLVDELNHAGVLSLESETGHIPASRTPPGEG